jgi:hypothetical protein
VKGGAAAVRTRLRVRALATLDAQAAEHAQQ